MTDTAQTQTVDVVGALRGFHLYVVYDNTTGKIIKYGQARDMYEDGGASMAMQADVGQSALAVSAIPDAQLTYAPAGVLTARPPCPVKATVAGRVVSLTGVPVGAAYDVSGTGIRGNATDSTPVFTFGAAGVYTIRVTCFPAIDFAQEFTLT